jgi:hypothetical protein
MEKYMSISPPLELGLALLREDKTFVQPNVKKLDKNSFARHGSCPKIAALVIIDSACGDVTSMYIISPYTNRHQRIVNFLYGNEQRRQKIAHQR